MPHHIVIASTATFNKTIAGTVNGEPRRITLLNERTLRIEPDIVCWIASAIAQDGQTVIYAINK